MGIIGNKTLLHKLPLTQVGGLFATDIATAKNWHCKENASKLVSVPEGYYAGGAWILPETSGSITVDGGLLGNHLFNVANLAGGLNAESEITSSGDIANAEIKGIAFLISSLNQSNTLNASIAGAVTASANLAGSGNLNSALGALVGIVADLNGNGNLNGQIAGALQAIAYLSGSGNIAGAIKATVGLIASLNGTSALNSFIIGNWSMITNLVGNSDLTSIALAKAFLNANIVSENNLVLNNGAVVGSLGANISSLSELSPESLASAVWSALASQYNQSGSMGEKLNGAGSAGNPWTEIIEGTYTAAEVMRLLASVVAGKTSINGTNVKFRDLNDTVDRVDVDMSGSERTNVNLDL